jgi:subtilisin family serine protease
MKISAVFLKFILFILLLFFCNNYLFSAEIMNQYSAKRYIIRLKNKSLSEFPEYNEFVRKKRKNNGLKNVSFKSDEGSFSDTLPRNLSTNLTLIRREQQILRDKIKSFSNLKKNSFKSYVISTSVEAESDKTKIIGSMSVLINALVIEADLESIDKISNFESVLSIQEDKKVKICLDESVPLINADKVRAYTDKNGFSLTGKGIKVAVIDTGVDYTHSHLGGGFGPGYKVVSGFDYVNYDNDPRDDQGHGTHVAGIIAAKGPELTGVAPECEIIALKVLDKYGSGYSSDVIEALEDALDMGAHIANISLGTMDDQALTAAAERAVSAGLVVCAAAGNEGPSQYTINSPGDGISVLCVAACTKNKDMWYGSSVGPASNGNIKPDITAPGENIYSLYRYNGYRYMSGTSMAAPHVSGTVALLMQYEPDLSPAQVKNRLMDNAVNLGFSHYRQGKGLVDIRAAVLNGHLAIPPEISFSAPQYLDEKADINPSRYIIKWIDKDEDSSASISLYYDTLGVGFNGTLIASGISEDSLVDQYIWNTENLSEGRYYIYGVISDGINQSVKKYAPGAVNVFHPPGIIIFEPSSPGIIVDQRVNCFWQDFDNDDNAKISIYADDNKNGLDGVLVASDIFEDDTNNFISIDVSKFERGKYFYIYAVIDDGKTQNASYSPGYFIRDSQPGVNFLFPFEGLNLVKDNIAEIKLNFFDQEEYPVLNLYYDMDNKGFDGTLIVGGITYNNNSPSEGLDFSYTWDMSDVNSGKYYIYARVTDGITEPFYKYSDSVFLKNIPPEFSFDNLVSGGRADTSFRIKYSLVDVDSDAYGKLYFDTNNFGVDGTFISNIDEISDEVIWDTSSLPSSDYWLYALICDEFNEQKVVYSDFPITINHKPEIDFCLPSRPVIVDDLYFSINLKILDEFASYLSFKLVNFQNEQDQRLLIDNVLAEPLVFNNYPLSVYEIADGKYYLLVTALDNLGQISEKVYDYPIFVDSIGSIRNVREHNLKPGSFNVSFISSKDFVSNIIVLPFSMDINNNCITGNTLEFTSQSLFADFYQFNISNLQFDFSESQKKGVKYKIIRFIDDKIIEQWPSEGYKEMYLPEYFPVNENISKVSANNSTPFSGIVFLKIKGHPELSIRSEKIIENGIIDLVFSGFYDMNMNEYVPSENDVIILETRSDNGTEYFEISVSSNLVDFELPLLKEKDYFVFNYSEGWNLLNIPIKIDASIDSSAVLNMTSAVFIASWDALNQQYISTLKVDDIIIGTTFEIKPGRAFFLKAMSTGSLILKGEYSAENSTILLEPGFNLTGVSFAFDPFLQKKSKLSSQTILFNSNEILGIYKWNSGESNYSYQIKLDSFNYLGESFNPFFSEGLFIKAKAKEFFIDFSE